MLVPDQLDSRRQRGASHAAVDSLILVDVD